MKETPISFTADMVNAVQDGRKTITRRVVKVRDGETATCPYGNVGDRLYVKETYLNHTLPGYPPVYLYRADGEEKPHNRKWKGGRFMPRTASRITLEITNVRVERLQDMPPDDVSKEGVGISFERTKEFYKRRTHEDWAANELQCFEITWNEINGKKHPWASNPWVWVIQFRKIDSAAMNGERQ